MFSHYQCIDLYRFFFTELSVSDLSTFIRVKLPNNEHTLYTLMKVDRWHSRKFCEKKNATYRSYLDQITTAPVTTLKKPKQQMKAKIS